MALPKGYLTTAKNLESILDSIRSAQAPERFNRAFLEELGFKSSADRLIIGVFKHLGFLDDTGKPTERYFRYLDRGQSKRVLAEGIRSAYSDLFRVNINAHRFSKTDLINKLKTLSQGRLSEGVLDKMALTFIGLAKNADFSGETPQGSNDTKEEVEETQEFENKELSGLDIITDKKGIELGGLVYNIQLILPETRDPGVYEALFQSLRRHLL